MDRRSGAATFSHHTMLASAFLQAQELLPQRLTRHRLKPVQALCGTRSHQ
jgi:hypothetical protein